jgi:hypothetical protein
MLAQTTQAQPFSGYNKKDGYVPTLIGNWVEVCWETRNMCFVAASRVRYSLKDVQSEVMPHQDQAPAGKIPGRAYWRS